MTEDTARELGAQRTLEAVLYLNRLLSTSIRINDVLDNAMNALEDCLEARDSSIYEVDYQTGELFFRLTRGDKAEDLRGRRLKIGEGVAGWVALHGRPKIVADAAADDSFNDAFDRVSGFTTKSMLTVPMMPKGTVLGVIQILNKGGRRPFTSEDLELAQIMAGQIGIALENARLYHLLEEKQEQTAAELARTQAELIRSERQAALAGLASGIAHQIRNRTISIGGFARRLLDKTAPDQTTPDRTSPGIPALARYAQVILQENERLEELVRRVVFLTSLSPKPMRTDLNELVRSAIDSFGPAPAVDFRPAPGLPRLELDPGLLKTAVLELITNSREAGAGQITVRTLVQGEEVWVELTDDGPGLAPEVLAAAPDPFFSSRAHNLGLGLPIVNRILDVHGGQWELRNHADRGAAVLLRLPLRPRTWT
jgi:signal transduction histidine kinase